MGRLTKLLLFTLCISPVCQVEVSAKNRQAANVISQNPNMPSPFAVGNFFSASAAATVKPSVEKRAGPNDANGQALTDHNPTLEQVRLIPFV